MAFCEEAVDEFPFFVSQMSRVFEVVCKIECVFVEDFWFGVRCEAPAHVLRDGQKPFFGFKYEVLVGLFCFCQRVSFFYELVLGCECEHYCDWIGADFNFGVLCLVGDECVEDGFCESFFCALEDC